MELEGIATQLLAAILQNPNYSAPADSVIKRDEANIDIAVTMAKKLKKKCQEQRTASDLNSINQKDLNMEMLRKQLLSKASSPPPVNFTYPNIFSDDPSPVSIKDKGLFSKLLRNKEQP